ncbi:Gfo/Idh/MocA family protein [Synoicihabitans lomoniglobus]|uniref:Gfo/Idh/MocA family oxidoreductase n=1 Tax=Synoicihabitans lomoniglobus TaxID=2909285 RepID=A0AAF0CNP1_9BACT|nr:Gfo/Idh/MocA family oxidoreductase [Opitutaceae bacterium LMO-M01]WED64655.1 Gfo/Idh/MocA family oxidoreductase [Opitutaceae bacterium LMO-M01]
MAHNPIGFAIVGTGMIAGVHAQAINAVDGARLVGVVSRSPDKAAAFCEQHGAEVVTATAAEMAARSDVQVLNITTPSGAHLEPALAAIAAGKHVVVEKPLEATTARADQIIAAAQVAGVHLAPIFQNRFSAGARTVKAAIEAGRLGRLATAGCYVKWFRTEAYYQGSPWKGTLKLDGGGAVMNQAIHGVDLLQWFAGLPEEVSAMTTRRVHTGIEAEDTAVAIMRFPDGALGTIEATTAAWPGWSLRIELCGENGSIRLEDGVITEWQFREELPEDAAVRAGGDASLGSGAGSPGGISIEGHKRQIEDLVAAIREDRPLTISGPESRRSVALITALYESGNTGQPVRIG